jgi:integrase/recombinase XerD
LSRLLASCVAWGYREDNPARFYDRSLLRERRDPIRPPDPRDVDTVIASAPAAMAKVLRLLDQTGMRANEAVTLAVEDIDFERRQISLTMTMTKTNRPRTIPFATPGGDAGPGLRHAPAHGPMFPSGIGKSYKNFPTNAAKVIAAAEARERKAKRPFRRFRVHDLRHGFAIRSLRAGTDIFRLSRHLGHTSGDPGRPRRSARTRPVAPLIGEAWDLRSSCR